MKTLQIRQLSVSSILEYMFTCSVGCENTCTSMSLRLSNQTYNWSSHHFSVQTKKNIFTQTFYKIKTWISLVVLFLKVTKSNKTWNSTRNNYKFILFKWMQAWSNNKQVICRDVGRRQFCYVLNELLPEPDFCLD